MSRTLTAVVVVAVLVTGLAVWLGLTAPSPTSDFVLIAAGASWVIVTLVWGTERICREMGRSADAFAEHFEQAVDETIQRLQTSGEGPARR